jgi:hypothetical protein
MVPVDFLIFSKNRPLQLEALLNSFFELVSGSLVNKIVVLFKKEPEYEESYEILKSNFSEVIWEEETDFQTQVLNFTFESPNFLCFLVDDILFYQEVKGDITPKDSEICFSLRLGKNCRFCHPANSFYNQPLFEEEDQFLRWYWNGAEFDFGYPMSLDGHIFKSSNLQKMIQNLQFRNPNSLENELTYRNPLLASFAKCKIRSFQTSRLVGIPVNRVNLEVPNRFGQKFPISEKELLEKFKNGESIDWQGMDFSQIIGSHQELNLKLKKTFRKK